MAKSNKMSRMLHVLIHMDSCKERVTSQVISKMLDTNPVLVRRTMSGLRKKGYVSSEKGRGGGWLLTCDLGAISVLDIYKAVGSPSLFSIGPKDKECQCLVEKAVDTYIQEVLQETEKLLLNRFSAISVADLTKDMDMEKILLHPL